MLDLNASPSQRTPSLAGSLAKLERGEEHIGLVSAHVQRSGISVTLAKETEVSSKDQILRVTARIVSVPELPNYWSLPIGDAVQNVRAALDYLVYELIALEAGGAYWEDSQFPIATSPSGHRGSRSKETIRRLGQHWAAIEKYQPYVQGSTPSLWESAFEYLNLLSNQDKHRLLVPVSTAIEMNLAALGIFLPSSGVRRVGKAYLNAGVLREGEILAWEDFQVVGDQPDVYMNERYTPLVCLPEIPHIGIDELLRMIHRKARELLAEFEPLF